MLEIINRYSHGYVLIPIVAALKSRKILDYMNDKGPFTAEELVGQGLNSGYAAVVFHLLESTGMLERRPDDRYLATDRLLLCDAVPSDIMALFNFPFRDYLTGRSRRSLKRWIALSERDWALSNPSLPLSDFLDGLLVIPLLVAMRQLDVYRDWAPSPDDARACSFELDVPARVRAEIEHLFLQQGWVHRTDCGSLITTPSGHFILNRIFTTAALAAYRPMLSKAEV